ncbi:RNA polymerase sigma factor [Jatrophihabitans sp. YIM 134969]
MVEVPPGPVTPSAPLHLPPIAPVGATRVLDDDVLTAAIAGDDAAFAVVFTTLHPLLRRYATVLVGTQADDVVSEAWLHIARDIRTFHGDVDGFRGWCARIVRNRAVDLVRSESRRPSDPTPHDARLDSVAPDDTAADALANLATEDAVALVAALPREQAEAVMLRVVLGLDTRSTATILAKTPGAVRVATHRGLRRLAREVRAEGGRA